MVPGTLPASQAPSPPPRLVLMRSTSRARWQVIVPARAALFIAISLLAAPLAAQPAGAMDREPSPPLADDRCCPPPPLPPPPVVVVPRPPRPLSDAAKIAYAPFYAAGLVLRYGLYYTLVAPFEVFGRALSYGAAGGVERPPRPRSKPPESWDREPEGP